MKKKIPLRMGMIIILVSPILCFANPSKIKHKLPHKEKSSVNTKIKANQDAPYAIEDALPTGYVKDGSVDYTDYLQTAITAHSNIVFPGFPIMVSDKGLSVGSNKVISFMKGSVIILKATAKSGYNIISLKNATNVTINSLVIKGDRNEHLGKGGEWGMGLAIISCTNIILNGPKVTDCWGDGIYLGETGTPNKNITISNAYCKNNRRNGISVISADGLKIVSPYLGFQNGTAPMSGIDLEPNNANGQLKNIVISNPVTESNKGEGILMFLDRIYADTDKNVSVTITNHKDRGSSSGFRVICSKLKPSNGKVTGTITTTSPSWRQNVRKPLDAVDITEPNIQLIVNGGDFDNKGKPVGKDTMSNFIKRSVSKNANFKMVQ